MENRQWMYDGRTSQFNFTDEWEENTRQFVEKAFDIPTKPKSIFCPCNKCGNNRRLSREEVSLHLLKNGFTPFYHVWSFHGEQKAKRARTELRQRQPAVQYDTGFGNCLDDFINANAPESPHVEVETP
jgi:hypothetical protein